MLHLKKPVLFCKLILLLLIFALLIPLLAGCQSAPTSSYEPLSEEKIEQIRESWEMNPPGTWSKDYHYNWDLTSEECYYGTHGDCIVIFDMAQKSHIATTGRISVANICFESKYRAIMFVYRNGEFADIQEAYELGWLTKEQIHSIAEYHSTIPERSWEEVK